jgi:hypothetical protein
VCDYCKNGKLIKPSDGYMGRFCGIDEEKPYIKICRDDVNVIYFVSDGNGTYFNIEFCPFCGEKL